MNLDNPHSFDPDPDVGTLFLDDLGRIRYISMDRTGKRLVVGCEHATRVICPQEIEDAKP